MYIRWKVVCMWFLEGEENAMDGQIGYSFWFACGADFHEAPVHESLSDGYLLIAASGGLIQQRTGGFSFAQKLLSGDILFFHLVGSCKLQETS
ncbi:hypothetical protein HanRHA438_Chr08g0364251 [Helianthus annuus]|uniref:Uncharacterized protein n=1 Tax=Helianthus annuus TaxID=4232 RepID=A0A251UAY5_HELAN|nr:hypothetical protein HanIR_Chr08g0379751 [Helianthus annuus]KAJ0899085.1 hypothetical protein HanRHA438_Chr08g0364251 [Helianthus annuus]